MIAKMKFVSLSGPKADIDRMVNKYLSKYEIHLENALNALGEEQHLVPYVQKNPYKDLLATAGIYTELLPPDTAAGSEIPLTEAIDLIGEVDSRLTGLREKKSVLDAELMKLRESMKKIEPYQGLEYDLKSILDFHFISYRFGKLPKEYFEKFRTYVDENTGAIFLVSGEDETYVYGVYFVSKEESHKVDATYASMHFERLFIPDEYKGTPQAAYRILSGEVAEKEKELAEIEKEMTDLLAKEGGSLLAAEKKIRDLSSNFDVRRMAACTESKKDTFYILCGWMDADDVEKFRNDIADDPRVVCLVQEDEKKVNLEPPTKLKNPAFFRPYEMYVKMYGLPNYNEFDPTILVAITYSFIFGIMYGDVGQGLCLMIGGFLLYKKKHSDLAGIISMAGIFSTIFGFMFGSIFGFEEVIPALWLRPREEMITLPGVGSINTILVCAIVFGMFLTLVTMVLHIMNYSKQKNTEETYFGTNSFAGIIFYGLVVVMIILAFSGHTIPAASLFGVLIALSALAMFFKEPLTKMIRKEKGPKIEGGIVMFLVQGFFEMFEVCLSYFSNTLSFVRIGAFAVSHAAMMSVVLMLAGAENGGSPNWVVVVLGNLFVMGIEGLIVGIQVLRLEFYELFSRYYRGDGKPFVSSLRMKEKSEG